MQRLLAIVVALLIWAPLTEANAATATRDSSDAVRRTGVKAAQTLSTVTGVAISPLLGVGAIGAYQYFNTEPENRAQLYWFAQPWFWIPALLLVAMVAAKDVFGTAAPTALKKPFDVAEALENKISALVVAGAFIPLITTVFATPDQQTSLADVGFAAINPASVGNALLVPFAIAAFAVVWLASHAINMLILLSPFTTVDTALKAMRLALLSLVTGTALINPYVGAAVSAVVLVVAFFIAGWSLRLLIFGNIYIWDFCTLRRKRFKPAPNDNRMFTARRMSGVPVRTYGRLLRTADGVLEFRYRPWMCMPDRKLELPNGEHVVGRGLIYPNISLLQDGELRPSLVCPPRYRTHEAELNAAYQLGGIREAGLRRGFAAIRDLFTGQQKPQPAAA